MPNNIAIDPSFPYFFQLSSLGTAILAMILICILFIADTAIVFWVSFMLVGPLP